MAGTVCLSKCTLCLVMARLHWEAADTERHMRRPAAMKQQCHSIPPVPLLPVGIAWACRGLHGLAGARQGVATSLQRHGRSGARTVGRVYEARQQAAHRRLCRDLRAWAPVSARSANRTLGSRVVLPDGMRTRGEHRCSSSSLQQTASATGASDTWTQWLHTCRTCTPARAPTCHKTACLSRPAAAM